MEIIDGGKAHLRQAKDLSPKDMALAIAYVEIDKIFKKKINMEDVAYDYKIGYLDGLCHSMEMIEKLLDVATLGDIDFDDVKKMRINL